MDRQRSFHPTRILLLRHGHVENPKGHFYSQLDVPLSQKGRRQSLEVARLLASVAIEAVFSSDLSRSLYLAHLLAEPRGLDPLKREDLREVDFGAWSGLTWAEIDELYPGQIMKRMEDLEHYRPPGGENMADVKKRILKIVDEIMQNMRGNTVAVVSHGGTNRIMLSHFLNLPIQHCFSLGQDYCCINEVLIFPDGNAVVKKLNWKSRIE